jgi:hypothetical protein
MAEDANTNAEIENWCDDGQESAVPTPTNRKLTKNLQSQEIETLLVQVHHLHKFIEKIGEIAGTPIRHDILEHCEELPFPIPCTFSKDALLKLAKSRVKK